MPSTIQASTYQARIQQTGLGATYSPGENAGSEIVELWSDRLVRKSAIRPIETQDVNTHRPSGQTWARRMAEKQTSE